MGKSAAGLQIWPLSYALNLSFFLLPVLKPAVRESLLLAAWSGLSAVGSILSYESLLWIGSHLFQMLKPANDMFRIDIFETLFKKTAHISLERVIFL